MLTLLAATEGIHISLKAEPLFKLGPLTVTNSILYGAICSLLITVFLVFLARRISVKPKKGFGQIIELIVDYVITLLEAPFGSRAKAIKYAPIFGTFFVFIIFTNLLALIPLVGPGLTVQTAAGHLPLFRPFTADLNGTIAMSVFAILLVQFLSIRTQGIKNHLAHYFTKKPWQPLNFFIGLLEVMGELTRITSLSLRLFLNTAVGEILVSVFTSMIAANGRTPLAVLPIILFEVLVAGIQAYVFTVLASTYLGLAIAHHSDHESPDELAHDAAPLKVEGAKTS